MTSSAAALTTPPALPEAPEAGQRAKPAKRVPCALTGKIVSRRKTIPFFALRPSLADRIKTDFPDIQPDALISLKEVGRYRSLLVEEMMVHERGELSELDRQVAESLADHETIAENTEEDFEEARSLGERLSDHLATFGGSWAFLITFGLLLLVWMAINIAMGEKEGFDPYPFILLNLVLSCLAAIQAPIIMMSQKRQEAKDRLRSLNDYKVNLKAELEIRHLHEKIDYLLTRQLQRLSEIQQFQLDIMQQEQFGKAKARPKRRAAKAKAKTKTSRRAATVAAEAAPGPDKDPDPATGELSG
jgi:uncharacterized membrane protein